MRRRSSSGSERVKPPKRKAASLKRSKAPKATRNRGVSILGQETFVARLTRERDEALLRETANSEILRLISSSPGDLELVFRTILEHATLICNAKFGVMQLSERDGLRAVALHDVPPAYALAMRRNPVFRPIVGHPLDRVASAKQVVHILDARAEQRMRGWMVELAGARTLLLVPMLKDNELVGVISIYRQEVCAFTDKQIALLQNFAAQAVIAIENARLLNELRQSLERQTATSEVLGVISRSPGELETVFHAILENATRICEANFGILQLLEGEAARIAAMHNVPAAFVQHRQREPLLHASPASAIGRAIATRRLVHIPDYAADAAYSTRDPAAVKLVELAGARSLINVPMLKDDELIGIISIYRQEVRPFTDKQIEPVQNFAAQAVIAIENARLLKELRQSLEQQTATADVLRVISSSPGELEPVFQAMLENATRICQAEFGVLYLREGDGLRAVALHGAPPAFAEERRRHPVIYPEPTSLLGRTVATKQAGQIADVQDEADYAVPSGGTGAQLAKLGGARSAVVVPMVKEDEAVGAIVIYRQEVRPFSDKQVDLLTNFAAQAVIAIENARLLNELRESLQQQTATADVLKVISRSTFDLQTVLDT